MFSNADKGKQRLSHMRHAQRNGKRVPPLWTRVVVLCWVVGVAAFGLLYLYSALGPPRSFRGGAFAVFRRELAQLPPYPNSIVSSETDKDGLLDYASLLLSYTLDGDCLDVHVYFEQLTIAHG